MWLLFDIYACTSSTCCCTLLCIYLYIHPHIHIWYIPTYMHIFVYGRSLATALCRSSTLANTQLGSGNVVPHIIFVPLTHIWCYSCALNAHTHTYTATLSRTKELAARLFTCKVMPQHFAAKMCAENFCPAAKEFTQH